MRTGLALFDTAIGPCALAWSEHGVRGVQLPEASDAATVSRLQRQHPDAAIDEPTAEIQVVIERLTELVAGGTDDLRDIDIDLSDVAEFNQRVYAAAREVGPGRTTTYGAIAAQLGTPHAAREVGQALGHNPLPLIVPCHRVLAAGGKVGGFSAQGGVATKLRLLAIEDAATPDGQPALF